MIIITFTGYRGTFITFSVFQRFSCAACFCWTFCHKLSPQSCYGFHQNQVFRSSFSTLTGKNSSPDKIVRLASISFFFFLKRKLCLVYFCTLFFLIYFICYSKNVSCLIKSQIWEGKTKYKIPIPIPSLYKLSNEDASVCKGFKVVPLGQMRLHRVENRSRSSSRDTGR